MKKENSKPHRKRGSKTDPIQASTISAVSSRPPHECASILIDGIQVLIPASLFESELPIAQPQSDKYLSAPNPPLQPESQQPESQQPESQQPESQPADNPQPAEIRHPEIRPSVTDATPKLALPQPHVALDPIPPPPIHLSLGEGDAEPALCITGDPDAPACLDAEFLVWLENTEAHAPTVPCAVEVPSQEAPLQHGNPREWPLDKTAPAETAQAGNGSSKAGKAVLSDSHGNAGPETCESWALKLATASIASAPSSHETASQPPNEKSGFHLAVDADLIVFGATEPDAIVTAGGQPVPLRHDGSFSLRLAFPDGPRELEIEAISSSGMQVRKAILKFDRQTRGE
jgi:hypothetical protein